MPTEARHARSNDTRPEAGRPGILGKRDRCFLKMAAHKGEVMLFAHRVRDDLSRSSCLETWGRLFVLKSATPFLIRALQPHNNSKERCVQKRAVQH
jgi:hypothetical protein